MNPRPASRLSKGLALLSLATATAALLLPGSAQAVPSFARQTGMACEACHTVFPELTPFGRRFKLNAYSIDNLPQVSDVSTSKEETLLLNQLPPLSFMLQASVTSTKKAVPDSAVAGANAQNNQTMFPQQASLFYAGRIAPNLGAFVQMTYDGTAGTFGWDNTDIRYAKNVNPDFLWGASLNNNPTVQDVWNTTAAWQSPFDQRSASSAAPGVGGFAMIDGGLGDVAGLSVYGYWNNSLYAELGGYRSAPAVGAPLDSATGGVVDGLAPYWRVAYERQWDRNSWQVGAYGVNVKKYPGVVSGPTDRYSDVALDSQYQYIGDQQIYSILGTYIKENQTLDATDPGATPTLKTFRVGGSYYYQRKYGAALGYFTTTGTASANTDLSANDQKGWTGEVDWIPYQNTKLALQYTAYNKLNGTSTNASDSNTLYLLGWINF